MSDPSRYPSQVFWSDEDEGFIAIAPDLPGCSAFGVSREVAAAELEHAIVAWIEAAKAAGNPIPAPSVPAAAARYSGKFLLRTTPTLHGQLATWAEREGVSLNQHVVSILTAAVAAQSVVPVSAASTSSPWALSRTAIIEELPSVSVATYFDKCKTASTSAADKASHTLRQVSLGERRWHVRVPEARRGAQAAEQTTRDYIMLTTAGA